MAELAKIIDELSNLTVLEAADLVKELEEKWGVKAAAGGPVMSPPLVVLMPVLRMLKSRLSLT